MWVWLWSSHGCLIDFYEMLCWLKTVSIYIQIVVAFSTFCGFPIKQGFCSTTKNLSCDREYFGIMHFQRNLNDFDIVWRAVCMCRRNVCGKMWVRKFECNSFHLSSNRSFEDFIGVFVLNKDLFEHFINLWPCRINFIAISSKWPELFPIALGCWLPIAFRCWIP